MQNFKSDQILCEDSQNIDKILPIDSVSLSIVVPPYRDLRNYYSERRELKKKNPKEWTKKIRIWKTHCFYGKISEKHS